jgi:hypothetical protein
VVDLDRDFDPRGLLATLDRNRVDYIVVGALARVIHGAPEVTDELDIVPSFKGRNTQRLQSAFGELGATLPRGRAASGDGLAEGTEPVVRLGTRLGRLAVVAQPAGTRGYDDLRRAATREHLGQGLRPQVASPGDLGRMLAALGREEDRDKLRALRRVAELEMGRGIRR